MASCNFIRQNCVEQTNVLLVRYCNGANNKMFDSTTPIPCKFSQIPAHVTRFKQTGRWKPTCLHIQAYTGESVCSKARVRNTFDMLRYLTLFRHTKVFAEKTKKKTQLPVSYPLAGNSRKKKWNGNWNSKPHSDNKGKRENRVKALECDSGLQVSFPKVFCSVTTTATTKNVPKGAIP